MPGGNVESRNAAYIRVSKAVRLFRYAVYLSIIVMLLWLFASFSFIRIEPGDDSVVGVSGFQRILVEKLSESADQVEHGDILVFAILNKDDRQVFRVSRVKGLPGDLVKVKGGLYCVNGEETNIQASGEVRLEGTVPPGFFFLLNDNPVSNFPDSRRLGFIDCRWVVGRYLSEMPF